jgi:histone H3/H4
MAKSKMKLRNPPPHRFRPGEVARREIIRYQNSTKTLFESRPFARLCKELLQDIQAPKAENSIYGFGHSAIDALQQSAEDYICTILRMANDKLVNRTTLLPQDIKPAVTLESQERVDRHLEFKQRRRAFEHEYRETIYSLPKLDKWEWDESVQPDEDDLPTINYNPYYCNV